MEPKKFLFVLSHATSNPMEVIVMLKIASNMKAFDDTAEVAVFLSVKASSLPKKEWEKPYPWNWKAVKSMSVS